MFYMNMDGLVFVGEKGEDESEIGENVRHIDSFISSHIFCTDNIFF